MSNFDFLKEWPEIQKEAKQAESLVNADPRGSCFYSRRTLEITVDWMYQYDHWLTLPQYDKTLNTLINQQDFRNTLGTNIFPKIKVVQKSGNNAVHSQRKVSVVDAEKTLKELHHLLYWFYRTYTSDKPPKNQIFDASIIPKTLQIDEALILQSVKKLKALEKQLQEKDQLILQEREKRLKKEASYQAKEQAKQQQFANNKKSNQQVKDSHDYNEAETREFIIDQYLLEAGWNLEDKNNREYPVTGMPNDKNGKVDYVLWGDNGKPLAVIEAKRTKRDADEGKQQAALYATCLYQATGQRPLIYYTNGYEIYFWDDLRYPSRPVQGFHSKDQLQRLIDKRTDAESLSKMDINQEIAGYKRPYQIQAIRSVGEKFDRQRQRKSLLVMATGTGKTRVTIALVDLLMRAGWVKNTLFLADRNALIIQAKKEFSKLLPKSSPSILSGGTTQLEGRVQLSTYNTMMNLLNAPADGRLFGIGHFDLVVVDEAHRSIYKKYRYIFDYFDSLLLGLTATPKSDLDKNTYEIFDIQNNVPTFAYELEQAIDDENLVPPKDVRVALKFINEGITYKDLSYQEQVEWEEKEELRDREEVLPAELNEFLYNDNTIDYMLEILMKYGVHVAGGIRLGKTIIFAANNKHAQFIAQRFDKYYPNYLGKFAQVVTYKVEHAQTLIDEFKGERKPENPEIPLSIAISVDMLDTGIDVPEVVNLVFFKKVKSKVKFFQMLGRGTRLCENLFGPGKNKEYFKVFDFCQNLEYFDVNPEGAKDYLPKSLSQVVFEKRLHLSQKIDVSSGESERKLKNYLLDSLHHRVNGMNLNHFIVRPKRQSVERYLKRERWENLINDDLATLINDVAELPTDAVPINEAEKDTELACRFDHLILQMQLNVAEGIPVSDFLIDKLIHLASQLERKMGIDEVKAQAEWINLVQTQDFWNAITLEQLEQVRIRLRLLLINIEPEKRTVVYTNFEDELQDVKENEHFYHVVGGNELTIYKKKVEAYIRQNQDDITIQRLKRNLPITQLDLEELDKKLFQASGITDEEQYQKTIHPDKSLGIFIRELIGLDRKAAKSVFADYLDETKFNSQQILFVNTIIEYLTQNGVMIPSQLFKPPFSDIHFEGVYGLFEDEQVTRVVERLRQIEAKAMGEKE
ncbi:DEAD/DEAH box helicase family protein [Aliikangiella sp. IMCC44359]|uniref:DEAD/DEAH box helicase family protein n=1 Tax=Aliikangiella sp. IMCC44359 TaxID=3459125 RepID=UPI00403AC293